MIILGSLVKDKVTGFEGIATSRAQYLEGCDRYCVCPNKLDKDGNIFEPATFDEGRLDVLIVGLIKPSDVQVEVPGGPRDMPTER